MTAKSNVERNREYRERKRAQGEMEVRGIFLPRHLHQKLREAAKRLRKRES